MALHGQRTGRSHLNPQPAPWWRRPAVLVGVTLVIGLVHVALVAPRYSVGSFDDDASYLLSAKALLAGQGLTGHLASGEPLVGLYLPGYGALLAPLVWMAPHSFLLARLVSVVCYAASFPLAWMFFRRRRMSEAESGSALVLLALCPVDATFASMVMAEMPFLVVLLLLFLALDRWWESDGVGGRWGWAVLVLAAVLLWLKQAGLGLVVGLVLCLPFTRVARKWSRSLFLGVGLVISVLPVLIARSKVGLPLAGDRYSMELGGLYHGGILDRLVHVLPTSLANLASTAIPATIVPYYGPLPDSGFFGAFWSLVSWHVTVLCVVGAVVSVRRRRDLVLAAMVGLYLAESALWPFVNERRVILVLPVVIAWYVVGAATAWRAVRRLRAGRRVSSLVAVAASAGVVFGPLVAQMPRDYLYHWNEDSSAPGGSPYADLLSALGPKSAVVETDYRSTISLFTGHPTAWSAFIVDQGQCVGPDIRYALAIDKADYLVDGHFNKPDEDDSPCLAGLLPTVSWAVPLMHTSRDQATVFELVGPGTAQPNLQSLITPASTAVRTTAGDRSIWTWQWSGPVRVSQLSVGTAGGTGSTSVAVEVRGRSGDWITLSTAARGVGDCQGCVPFLLVNRSVALEVSALRVVVTGGSGVDVRDVAAIGPSA